MGVMIENQSYGAIYLTVYQSQKAVSRTPKHVCAPLFTTSSYFDSVIFQ